MILLAGFLEVLFRALALIGLSLAVGGVFFTLAVLRPMADPAPFARAAAKRALLLIVGGGVALALSQGVVLVVEPWALADEMGRWPLAQFLATRFARAGVIHAALGFFLAAAGAVLLKRPSSRRWWGVATVAALLLMMSGAWLVHAVSRLEGAATLMAVTVLHQLGAAVWIGGVAHLTSLWRLARRSPEGRAAWPRLLARFSPMAMASVATLVAAGGYLFLRYIGDWQGAVGTAYGAMVLSKVATLAAALALGGLNYLGVRRWKRSGDGAALFSRAPVFLEAEMAAGMIILCAAAALTSQPPAVDIRAERAAPAEVLQVFAPKMPQLTPPPYREMVAHTVSSLDPFALPGTLDKMQSNFNHNVAGLFVLLAGLAALLDRGGRVRTARHWPLLLLPLALFLLLFAEPNGWPFGHEGLWKALIAPGVLLHRLATLLVALLALFEWRVRAGGLADTRWRFVFPLLCAAGGGLLLLHSHSVSAVKWAFLIELSHNAIGVLAVLMLIGRWLELRLPPPTGRLPGLLWSGAMTLAGLVLIFYREV